eukprot:TRINITY_DN3163_c0_g1_i1.p1 TRINITY_DN3163_c0_g1~~TRINITY_DN3163_c0_g1_i1.p1  ORF type:complete len:388 (+),score=69.23 TRINITY_DN3163_c0_g1_i1:143-1306(+)
MEFSLNRRFSDIFPKVSRPKELSYFTEITENDLTKEVRFDKSGLKRICSIPYDCQLNSGFEVFKKEREQIAWNKKKIIQQNPLMKALKSSDLGNVLKSLNHFDKNPLSLGADVVSFRNNLNKIMGTPYDKEKGWIICVEKIKDTLFLDIRDLPNDTVLPEERHLRMMYWGYKFEQLVTTQGSAEIPDTLPNDSFCSVVRVKLGRLNCIIAGEVDCCEDSEKKSYVELKTTAVFNDRNWRTFQRHKSLKYWIQSFLLGIKKIGVGQRDDSGIIREYQEMKTQKLAINGSDGGFWSPAVCTNFTIELIDWIKSNCKLSSSPYFVEYNPNMREVKMTSAPSKESFVSSDDLRRMNELGLSEDKELKSMATSKRKISNSNSASPSLKRSRV